MENVRFTSGFGGHRIEIIDALPDPTWTLNASGEFACSNNAALAYFGVDIERTHWHECIHQNDRSAIEAWMRLPAGTENSRIITCRLRRASGEYRWFRLQCCVLPRQMQRESHDVWLFCAHDVHDDKAREWALEERLRNQSAMLDTSIDCIKVISVDGRLIDMNRAGCLALGVAQTSGFGMDWLNLLPEDVRANGREALAAASEGKIGRFPGRSEIPGSAPRHWDNVLTPVLDEEGKTRIILCLSRDVTEQRELEEQLKLSNRDLEAKVNTRTAELAQLWHTSLDLLLVISRDRKIVRVNPAWHSILGYEIEELVGRHVDVLIAPEDQDFSNEVFGVTSSNTQQPREIRHLHKDGSLRWIGWIAVPSGSEVYATGRDMTAAREAREKLRATEDALHHAQKVEMIGRLTGSVAHDFNNLLSVIHNSLALFRNTSLPEQRRAHFLELMSSTTERAIAVTRQLLDFAHRSPFNPVIFCVSARVVGLRDMLAMVCGSGINVIMHVDEEPCYAFADPSQFDTALINLTTNARDAMQGRGSLTINIRSTAAARATWRRRTLEGSFIAVSMEDTGPGIPKDIADRIFEPFFTTKQAGNGTGLGLSQVMGFAEQSGGAVEIGRSSGVGATLTLYLPHAAGTEVE